MPNPASSHAARRVRRPSISPRPRVLVVDDEAVVADTTAAILRQQGYAAECAYTCRGALKQARFWHPDIVLMDVLMPDGSGVAAAVELRSHYPGLKILMMSGQTVTTDLLEELRTGGISLELLPKPITPPALIEKLELLRPR